MIGLFFVFKTFLSNLININEKNDFLLWKNNKEMNELFILFVFLIPIFIVIMLNSTLYTGWRHLYFVYPPLIFIAVKGVSIMQKSFSIIVKRFVYISIFFQMIYIIYVLFNTHPVQSVYFNSISKNIVRNSFFHDYWGLGNKTSLEKLINMKKDSLPIKISVSSLTDLNKTKLIIC